MSKKDTFLKRIEDFLAVRGESTGGYAAVGEKDIEQLHDLVQRLLELKYDLDPDGDLPVEAILTDRTRFERPFVIPVLYTHKPYKDFSELELHQQAASAYAVLASSAMGRVKQEMDMVQHSLRDMSRAQRPLTLGGNRYVARAPEGLTVEKTKATLLALVVKAYKKEPCPVEYPQRDRWSDAIAAAASKKLGIVITANSCHHIVEGVRMSFNVGVFDTLVRISTAKPADNS